MTANIPGNATPDGLLRRAVVHHQAGRLQEAEQLYRAILRDQPFHADANHNIGVLATQRGQQAAGLPYLKTALALNPGQIQYALSYAQALVATGQAKEALDILQAATRRGLDSPAVRALRQEIEAATQKGEAPAAEVDQLLALFNAGRYADLEDLARSLIARYPDFGFAWKALSSSLQLQGKEALAALQKAAELLPDDADAHNNLGYVLNAIGQCDDAVASYRRALAIKPDYAEVHSNLSIAQQALGRLDEAVFSCRRALEFKPDYAEAHYNLGNSLQALGRFDDAVVSYRRALEITPNYPGAHGNLGNALRSLGQIDDAVASYRQALETKPDYAEVWNNLGVALQALGQIDDSLSSYRRALAISPDYAEAHCNLGAILQVLGRLDDARGS